MVIGTAPQGTPGKPDPDLQVNHQQLKIQSSTANITGLILSLLAIKPVFLGIMIKHVL